MALQTSGAISLNDIHVEAGGSSGTQASINDSDIRNLISKGSGAQMSFNEWYGASAMVPITKTYRGVNAGQFVGNPGGTFNIGSASANRWVVALCMAYPGNGFTQNFSGCTIGGVTATGTAQQTSSVDGCRIILYYAQVPSGTSATVTTTIGNSATHPMLYASCAVYTVSHGTVAATPSYYSTSGNPHSWTQTVKNGGVGIYGASGNQPISTLAWTNATGDVNSYAGGDAWLVTGSYGPPTSDQVNHTAYVNYLSAAGADIGSAIVFDP